MFEQNVSVEDGLPCMCAYVYVLSLREYLSLPGIFVSSIPKDSTFFQPIFQALDFPVEDWRRHLDVEFQINGSFFFHPSSPTRSGFAFSDFSPMNNRSDTFFLSSVATPQLLQLPLLLPLLLLKLRLSCGRGQLSRGAMA